MSEWAQKRFWTQTAVLDTDGGFGIGLDGRQVKTPAKAALTVPTRALAEAIVLEWDAQTELVDPTQMPMTRMANSAIDKVAVQRTEVADLLADYGDSDLLCYRAERPEGLIARQAEAWDPLLDWAARTLGARLEPRTGVMPKPQDPAALAALRGDVHRMDPFTLAAFHDLVALSGSLVIGFAALHGQSSGDNLWAISRIDEAWQEDQWGEDEEAQQTAEIKKSAFLDALKFHALCSE
ncbi:MAG: ATPase [Rhodobacteraceae bacterium]|nr:ATPase [Paracoccaceae bacterium]